jgi:DNA-binding XRE family transcriptional regulator
MPRQNISPAEYPQAVLQQIAQLGRNIAIARKRRAESQAQWAKKLGVSQPTMARIERGDPAVSMASYAMCLWLISPAQGLADLIAPLNDHAALEKELARLPIKRQPACQSQRSTAAGAPIAGRKAAVTPTRRPLAHDPLAAARGLQSLLAGASGGSDAAKKNRAVAIKLQGKKRD